MTDTLSQLLESVREAIGQEFVTLLEGYNLVPTIDRSRQLDEYLNDHPHIAVDMVAVQMQAALAVVRYTARRWTLNGELVAIARHDGAVRRLVTIPGVNAAAFGGRW